MIEIRLTDTDAIEYLETQNPDISALVTALKTATQYIDKLEEQAKHTNKLISTSELDKVDPLHTNVDDPNRHNISGGMNRPAHHQEPSNRILRDTEIAKETTVPTAPSPRWSEQEIKVIDYAMSRPESELNRKFSVLVTKLDRTEASVRSKLSEMNLYVNTDVIYHK